MRWVHFSNADLPVGTTLKPDYRGLVFVTKESEVWSWVGEFIYVVEPLGTPEVWASNDSLAWTVPSARVLEKWTNPWWDRKEWDGDYDEDGNPVTTFGDPVDWPPASPPSRRLASPTSWRPYATDTFWRDHDVVITSEGGGGGRRAYEVFVNGWVVATRPRLDEAKAAAEHHVGKALTFKQQQLEPYELQPGDHAYESWGPTEEFTSPSTIWIASI